MSPGGDCPSGLTLTDLPLSNGSKGVKRSTVEVTRHHCRYFWSSGYSSLFRSVGLLTVWTGLNMVTLLSDSSCSWYPQGCTAWWRSPSVVRALYRLLRSNASVSIIRSTERQWQSELTFIYTLLIPAIRLADISNYCVNFSDGFEPERPGTSFRLRFCRFATAYRA